MERRLKKRPFSTLYFLQIIKINKSVQEKNCSHGQATKNDGQNNE